MSQLCSIDSEGNLSELITESAKPRVNPDMFECKIANKGNDIFVWSDRTGWGHIYHYDGHGRLLNPVTSGNWTAGRICAIDEKAKLLFFYATGMRPGATLTTSTCTGSGSTARG